MVAPKILITAGMMIMNVALTASQKINGPRLDDLSWTGADPGTPRPRFFGTHRGPKTAFWGEPLREVRRRQKTKGGKYNSSEYYGTEAVEIACHQIDAVNRIWADGHLVYDLTGKGPVMPYDFGRPITRGAGGDYIRIYLGSDDQEPDPRMQASVEAKLGAGYCPAYRDTAYFIYEDLPLSKFGNRRPQWIVEGTRNAVPSYPFDENPLTPGETLGRSVFSSDYGKLIVVGDTYTIFDIASRTPIIFGEFPASEDDRVGLFSDGRILFTSAGGLVRTIDLEGSNLVELANFGAGDLQENAFVAMDADGVEHWGTVPNSTNLNFAFNGFLYDMNDLTGLDWRPTQFFADKYGDVWAVGCDTGGSVTAAHFYRMVNASGRTTPDLVSVTGLPTASSVLPEVFALHYSDSTTDRFVFNWNALLYAVDVETGTVEDSIPVGFTADSYAQQIGNCPPGATSLWIDDKEIALASLTLLRTIDWTDWLGAEVTITRSMYDPINHALITTNNLGDTITWRYLDRVGNNTVTLGSITAEICALAGIASGEIDTSLLVTPVRGYGVSQGDGKDWLAPLLDLYDVDPRPDGFLLDFKPRGGAPGATIAEDGFVRSDTETPLHSRLRPGGSDIPRQVTIRFADADAEQQPNGSSSPWLSDADGERELQLDFTGLVLTANEARDLVTRYHRRMEFEAQPATLDLPASRVALQPGDRHLLGFAGGAADYRLHSMALGADMRIETEWRRDDASVAQLPGLDGGGLDGHLPTEIVVPLPTRGFVADIPLIRDGDDGTLPVLHAAAAPYAAGSWPGAVLYEGFGSGSEESFEDELATFGSADGATWGVANTVLPPAPAYIRDRGTAFNVVLQSGALTGATEDAIDADPQLNLMLVGAELIQFTSAVLEGDGSYTLSNLKRGCRGTEWAIDGHSGREIVLLMDAADARPYEIAEIGTTGRYKAITLGRSDGFVQSLERTGASKKPYAPANVTAHKLENGDWVFAWNRRTRIGAGWGLNEVPLGEASEAYELDLGNGLGSVTKASVTTSFTWTQAAQIADLGGEVAAGALEFSIFQISATVGRGFAASGTA